MNTFATCEYHCWTLEKATQFVNDNFSESVLEAFHCLKPLAYKADLFKYCVLYAKGGWYIDAGVRALVSPEGLFKKDFNPKLVLFRSTGGWDAPWNCSLAFLYAYPKNPVFITAIKMVVENCRNKDYGENPLCPTMSPFGRSLAIHNENKNIKVGQVVDINHESIRRGFWLPPIGLVGTRKPKVAKVGNVVDIGLPGGNNYAKLWKDRDVYG